MHILAGMPPKMQGLYVLYLSYFSELRLKDTLEGEGKVSP